MARSNKVTWHKTDRWYFSKTLAGKKTTFYASPEIPNTAAGRRKATEWMEGVLRELEDRVVTGDDWTLDDLRLAYMTWRKRRVAARQAKQHTLEGHRKHLLLICNTPRAGKTYGHVLARELTTKIVGELVRRGRRPGGGRRPSGTGSARSRPCSTGRPSRGTTGRSRS